MSELNWSFGNGCTSGMGNGASKNAVVGVLGRDVGLVGEQAAESATDTSKDGKSGFNTFAHAGRVDGHTRRTSMRLTPSYLSAVTDAVGLH